MRLKPHCKRVSRLPEVASTGFQQKLDFLDTILQQTVLLQRQLPWKAFFPIGGGGGTTTT
ncbi:MAG: hypothetical protein HZB26_25935 [Candidatus Hydrogenedentes bacterium]|nr:hypothetical protein [Candidatus Hydrogenedentota bacterium]